MDTSKYNQIEHEAAKNLLVFELSSLPKITHVKLLSVSVFHVDLNTLRIDQT